MLKVEQMPGTVGIENIERFAFIEGFDDLRLVPFECFDLFFELHTVALQRTVGIVEMGLQACILCDPQVFVKEGIGSMDRIAYLIIRYLEECQFIDLLLDRVEPVDIDKRIVVFEKDIIDIVGIILVLQKGICFVFGIGELCHIQKGKQEIDHDRYDKKRKKKLLFVVAECMHGGHRIVLHQSELGNDHGKDECKRVEKSQRLLPHIKYIEYFVVRRVTQFLRILKVVHHGKCKRKPKKKRKKVFHIVLCQISKM